MTLWFGVLGPLEVRGDGQIIPVSAGKLRVLLATLLLRPNQTVSTSELVQRLWDEAPAGARATIRAYVMRLRRLLAEADDGESPIRTESEGYRVELRTGALDLHQFTALVERAGLARAAGDVAEESAQLGQALALWRGEPLTNVPSPMVRSEALPRLVEQLLNATERRNDADLLLGRHADLVAGLRELVRRHPLRERFWAQLMLALYRSGRSDNALAAYQELAVILAEELGVDPGDEVRRLHQSILVNDADLALPGADGANWRSTSPPAQLPADIGDFVGRQELAGRVRSAIGSDPERRSVPIVTVSGPPGVGKTALAVHVAHKASNDFPDGQLYVDLAGFAPGPVLTPSDALAGFLRVLGVPPARIPLTQDEQTALYRSRLAGRRVLVVLDNASSPDQVRPLLPGEPGCAVMVTSRDELRGLTAINGAHPVRLDVLSEAEATALLESVVGSDVAGAEPAAMAELAELCGYLPLALHIAAANLSSHADVVDYIRRLRSWDDRLAVLAVDGDEHSAVMTAFDLSYETLSPSARRVFRLLGLVPGTDFTARTTAAVADIPLSEAERVLRRLTTANLILWHPSGRYRFHDLLRLYAAARVELEDGAAERDMMVRRVLSFLLRATRDAATRLYPGKLMLLDPLEGKESEPGVDQADAMSWFAQERGNLVAAIDYAAEHGPLEYTWHLAYAMWGYLHAQRIMVDWAHTAEVGLRLARQAGDEAGQAAMIHSLGVQAWCTSDYQRAAQCFRQGIEIHRRRGFPVGEAVAHQNLGAIAIERGQLAVAVVHFDAARSTYLVAGRQEAACDSLINLGVANFELGRLADSERVGAEAAELCRRIGYRYGETAALGNTGRAMRAQGKLDEALEQLTAAIEIARQLGVRDDEADSLRDLAELHRDAGRWSEALGFARDVLTLSRETTNRRYEVDALTIIASVDHLRGRAPEAVEGYTASLALARKIGYQLGTLAALLGLASGCTRVGRYADALTWAREGLGLAEIGGFGVHVGLAHTVLAAAYLGTGDRESALEHATTALAIHDRTGHRLGQRGTIALLSALR